MYPTAGDAAGVYAPEPDEELEQAVQEENTFIAKSLPVLAEMLAWFDEQIDSSQSLRNIDLTDKSKLPADAQVLAYRRLSELLVSKRDELQTRADAWESRRKERPEDSDAA